MLGAPLLGACAGVQQSISQFSVPNPFSSSQPAPGPGGPQQPSTSIGNGQVKVALILPLSAGGNAGTAATSMKNASEMALAEFLNPNLQLLIKDDAGSPQGAHRPPSRRSTKARKSFSGRCLRPRSRRSLRWRADAAFR